MLAKAGTKGSNTYGYRITESIAPYINENPFEVNSVGNVIAKNYQKALVNAKKWTTKNLKNYTLNNEIY